MKTICEKCDKAAVRNGKSKNGRQRYYCRGCKRSFQGDYCYVVCEQETVHKIMMLVKESCRIRSISRILRISVTTVVKRIKLLSKTINRPFVILKDKEYEVDEMRTYIGNKKRLYWIVYALRRDTKEIIDFKVGKRTMKTLKRVLDTLLLSEANQIHTDG